MKKKMLWLVVSCLMVAALVLSACAPAAPPEKEVTAPTPEKEVATPTPEKEVAPTPKVEVTTIIPGMKVPPSLEVPRYGGTLNVGQTDPSQGFDDTVVQAWWALSNYLTGDLMTGADRTKGLGGTGETRFWGAGFNYGLGLEAPALAEKWELPDANTVILHIRKGVHYGLNPKSEASRLVGGREMTPEDVAFNINRHYTARQVKIQPYGKWFRSVEVDGNKVILRGQDSPATPLLAAMTGILGRGFIYPPEVIKKYGDMVDWRNSVGQGPFMLVDFVSASQHTFVRNPNYWATDMVGPGKGMQLPYVDVVKWLDLRDIATRTAAFRTGKIDLEISADKIDADRLIKDNPKLNWGRTWKFPSYLLHMRTDKPELPFYDVRVRRALALAINNQEIADTLYQGDAEVYGYPTTPGDKDDAPYHLPFEKLPRETQMLWEYHPEEAKRLMVEAGYPDGFKTNIILPAYTEQIDTLSMVKAYWAKIGVDLTLDPREFTVFNSIRVARSHTEMAVNRAGKGAYGQFVALRGTAQQNLSMVDDPYIHERYERVWAWENAGNEALRVQAWHETWLYAWEQVYIIPFPWPYIYRMWWPWLKNHHGEYFRYYRWAEWVWIDQELKKAMGYR